MPLGRLYQLIGAFSVLCVAWYCWRQCEGLRFRRAIPVAVLVTFVFIFIHFKSISAPLLTYAAIGGIGIPAILYGLLYSYELLLIVAAIYIPHLVILPAAFGGVQQALNGTNIVLMALLIGMVSSTIKGRIVTYKSPAITLVLIFCLAVGISYVRGGILYGSEYIRALLFEFKRFITSVILFYFFVRMIPNRETIKILASVILIVVVMALYLGVLEWVNLGFGTYTTWNKRLGGLNMQPNVFGAFLAYYSCLFFGLWLTNFQRWEGKLLLFPFLLGVRMLLPTNSRGAWISFPPALLTVAFLRSRLVFIATIAVFFLPFIINPGLIPETIRYRFEEAAIMEQKSEIYHSRGGVLAYAEESKSVSIRMRTSLLKAGLKLWGQNLFFGNGYGTFMYMIPYYTETGHGGTAHNFFLQMLCEMGLVAVLSLLLLFVYFVLAAIYVFKREEDRMLKGLALGYCGIIPAIIIANLTGDRFNHVDLTAIFWMLSACIVKLRGIITIERERAGALETR